MLLLIVQYINAKLSTYVQTRFKQFFLNRLKLTYGPRTVCIRGTETDVRTA